MVISYNKDPSRQIKINQDLNDDWTQKEKEEQKVQWYRIEDPMPQNRCYNGIPLFAMQQRIQNYRGLIHKARLFRALFLSLLFFLSCRAVMKRQNQNPAGKDVPAFL